MEQNDSPQQSPCSESESLSLPMPDDSKTNKSEEISEHLSLNNDSIENDRSFQEIEVSNGQNLFNLSQLDDVLHISQEKSALDTSLHSEHSIISLNYLQDIENRYLNKVPENVFRFGYNNSDREESFNIFADLDLDDKSLSNLKPSRDISLDEKNLYATNFGLITSDHELDKRIKDFEELITIKDNTIAALTFELDSIKENSNVNTGSTLSTTEYKQIQDEWHTRLSEFNSAIIYKNELIQQLTESLDQSVKERKEMLEQIEEFKNVIADLQSKIQDSELRMVAEEPCLTRTDETHINIDKIETKSDAVNKNLSKEYLNLEETLDSLQRKLLLELKAKFDNVLCETVGKNNEMYENEIKKLKDNTAIEKEDFEAEITKLRNLLDDFKSGSARLMDIKSELEAKHEQEMEKLRTYFERKCVDLEKNYSEEIFSQHSRKMSSSSCSEGELNSDLPYSHIAGPEGDGLHGFQSNLSKKDVINLQNELNSIINKISKCDLDNMSDEDFSNLKLEICRSDLKSLLKFDAASSKSKHHKERDAEKQHPDVSSAVQEVGSSGEFEIHEVIQSYERRLQEQVTLAKIDIISAFELQIQRLASNEANDDEWPSELLKLRDRFTEKYEAQIEHLIQEHRIETEKLKEEHLKVLNGVLERAKRRSLRDEDGLGKGEIQLLKERDSLKRQVTSLRNLLGELVKYFTQCEDELNNTLVDELLKCGFDKNLSQTTEDELNLTNSSSSKNSDSALIVTRVHLIPNVTDLINIIESSSTEDGDSKDISMDLKNELEVCLEKLKQEANAVLTLTNNVRHPGECNETKNSHLEEQLNSLARKLVTETQAKDALKTRLDEIQMYVESLEKEKERLDAELEVVVAKENALEDDLSTARSQIAEFLESGRKEIVSEDYGEQGLQMQSLGDTMKVLSDLQERARNLLSQTRSSADPSLLQLIEELCRVGEKVKDESKKDRYDLLRQIEAADKKYRTTQQFLEEQAMEREQERDESQKTIDDLYNQLKERDKDKIGRERATSEVNGVCTKATHRFTLLQVERLEHQLQEKAALLAAAVRKSKETETERNEAVEKIQILREIIRELETQTESKSKEIDQYVEAVKKLQCIVEQQDRVSEAVSGCSTRNVSDVEELYKHVEHLENELQTLRLHAELAGNEGAIKQFRTQLYEIECQVDRKTKELETLHSTASTNCSSPSEDVSARELVLPKSPKKMEECEVPLQQLARLKEKLIRHSRAEDAAMKRIRDLEMQVFRLKQEIEETTGERDYMKKQIQEQLVLISDFQIRLDEQRIRADNIEKQTNTSFELKIYDLQYEITSLREKLQQKEKALGNQQVLLTETQDRLRNIENELITSKDDELIVSMQREVEKLRADNAKMKTKIKNDASMLPNLVGNIISDKNTDMARLRSRLDDTEKLLEEYTSLKLDKKDLKTLASMKSNGTSLEELFSILDLSQADQLRRMEYSTMSTPSMFIQRKKKSDDSAVEPEISAIAGPGTTASQFQTRNSTEISHKKVHFEDGDVEDLKTEIENLKKLVESKDDVIKEYDAKLTLLNDLEGKIEKLQSALEETEKTLTAAKETFEKEQQELKDREKDLGVQLAEKKLALEMKQKQLEVLECDSKRKDETHKNLTRELKSLEKEIVTLKNANFKNVDRAIQVKNKEIEDLTVQLARKANVDIERLEQQLSEKNNEMSSLLKEIEQLTIDLGSSESRNKLLEASLTDKDNEMKKMNKELENKMTQIESMTGELTALKEKLNKKRKIIRDIQDAMDNQKKSLESMQEDQKKQQETIDILNEDADRYQNDICILKTEIKELKKEELKKQMDEMETQIEELNKERAHLMDLLNEKEKIISQMAEDSHQLHVNLMTIKTKIKEPGNIIDLGNKLRDEQRKTAELVQEIHNLKAQLMQFKNNDMTSSIDEIADQLKRELDHSNRMDSNILSAVSDQSLNSISDMHDVEVCKKALSKEKNNKKQLLQHVHILQSKIAALQVDLERERAALVQTRTEDAQCIEQLRIQLDSCLDSEAGYKKIFDEKNAENERLEKEVNELKVKNAQNSKSESTEYKQLPSKEVVELKQLRKDFETLQGEKNQLANELSHLKQSNLETESGYKCTKDILALEVQRKNKLEEKVQNFLAREKELKDCLMQKNLEMERVVDEMSQEKADLIKQKLELLERIKSQNQFSVQAPPSTPSPSELFFKVQELNSALIDNKKFMDLIAKLTNEKKQLEIELDVAKNGSNRNANVQMSTNDLIARADYLFAKTLKLESVRKALIFQKRYLMQYLTSHQKECPISALPDPVVQRRQFRLEFTLKHRFRAAAFVVISLIRMKYLVRRWHSGVRIAEKINARHFKNASRRSVALAHAQSSPAHFQVGQPVSSQLFANLPTTATVAPTRNLNPFIIEAEKIDEERGSFTSEDRWSVREGRTEGGPWSGNTPPSKEKLNRMNFRSTESNRDDITPLRAPQLLAQFVERFDQMQEKLGFVVESNSS